MTGDGESPYNSSYHHASMSQLTNRPSLSPSITSLLNPAGADDNHNDSRHSSLHHTNQDYFFPPPSSPTPSDSTLPAHNHKSTTGSSSSSSTNFAHLLAPEASVTPDDTEPASLGTHRAIKRPRSSSIADEDRDREDNRAMRPPPSRSGSSEQARRASSSTSSPSLGHSTAAPLDRARATATQSPAPRPISGASSRPHLEPSVFNIEPLDEFTREVADWLWGFCSQLPWEEGNVEVSKTGVLLFRLHRS